LPFVITGQRLLPGAGLPVFKWQMKNGKWKMENLVPPSQPANYRNLNNILAGDAFANSAKLSSRIENG
jgi:hypothetical protein